MKRPLVWWTFIFCAGILVASLIKTAFLLTYCLALAALIFSFLLLRNRLKFNIFVSCFVSFLGAALWKNYQILPKCHISRYISYKSSSPYTIRGFIKNDPSRKGNKTTFIFQAEEIKFANLKSNCCGDVLVYVSSKKNLHYAEELILTGNLYRPFSFGIPRRHSYRDYLYNQGIRSIMHAKTINLVVSLNKHRGSGLKRLALWSKAKMEEIFLKYNSPVAAGILDAMILGEKRNVPVLINNAMIKSGTVHILPRLYTKMPPIAL